MTFSQVSTLAGACLHKVYTTYVEFEFDESSYDRIRTNGVGLSDVLYALRDSRPRLVRHLGAVLQLAARDRQDRWIGITAVETLRDGSYLVYGARYLDEQESTQIADMLLGGKQDGAQEPGGAT